MTFDELIKDLKRRGLKNEADALQLEVTREWERGGSSVVKRMNKINAEAYFIKAIEALQNGMPASVTPTGYKFELSEAVADALRGERRMIRPLVEPQPEAAAEPPEGTSDLLEKLMREGVKVKVEWDADEGQFEARGGGVTASGETWERALAELANKLSQDRTREPGSGEYSIHRKDRK